MTNSFTFRSMLAMMLFLVGFSASAQSIWTATFSDQGAAEANWTSGGTNGGSEVWTWTDDPLAGVNGAPAFDAPTAGDGYFIFNSDANGEFDHDVWLTGPSTPISTLGSNFTKLKFYTQYIPYTATASAQVGVSTDGTNFTYKTILTAVQPDQIYQDEVVVDLPEAANKAQVWIRFRWIGNYEYHWKVDDVELYNETPPLTAVTFRVNMSQVASVDPAGVRIAGTFNNWSDEVMTNDGNGIWSITKSIFAGTAVQYKFKNGPNGWENVTAACGVSDGFGGFNRGLTVPAAATTLTAPCFSSCNPCVVNCSTNPDAIICDDIETYNTGNVSPQSPHWIPWDLNENSIVGAEVSTEQASNGTKSVKCRYQTSGALQGDDQLLLLGEKTTGRYSLKWKMFVPTGKAAYFNVQGTELTPGTTFAIENYFLANRSIDITTNVRDTIPNAYPQNEWFQFEGVFDLNNNIAQFYINGNLYKSFPFTTNLGGIDFYCANNTYLFYLDEIEYVKLTDLTFNADECATAVDLTPYFGGDLGTALTSGLYDNTNATKGSTDPVVDCWGESAGNDIIDRSMWFTFYGDGEQYHIETVPCNATNYIGTAQDDPGDTQMAIYTGSCGNYELVACNDDLFSDGDPDWRSAVDLLTTEGEQYFMLIDGFNFQGTVATGQYCIQVSRGESVDCADAAVGTYGAANDAIVCNGASTNTALSLTAGSFTLPTVGEVKGMAWAISTADPAGEWPGTATGYWGSFPFSTEEYVPGLVNDNDPLAYGEWWFTPVVIGNGVDGNTANGGAFVHDIDPSVACWVTGSSIKLTLLPPVDALSATYTSTNETLPPGNNGAISVTPAGGYAGLVGDVSLYNYTWSNGATTANLTNIAGGTYSVTISDTGNCTAPITLTVGVTTGVEDPSSVRSLVLSPNPTSGSMRMSLELENSSDVSVHIMNTLGQVMQSLEMGKVNGLKQDLNLANLPDGAYFLRVTIDGETAIRRVVVQR